MLSTWLETVINLPKRKERTGPEKEKSKWERKLNEENIITITTNGMKKSVNFIKQGDSPTHSKDSKLLENTMSSFSLYV